VGADDQPVEQLADRSKVLFDGRLGGVLLLDRRFTCRRHLQRLDIGSDVRPMALSNVFLAAAADDHVAAGVRQVKVLQQPASGKG
jgi:hypothetical protein